MPCHLISINILYSRGLVFCHMKIKSTLLQMLEFSLLLLCDRSTDEVLLSPLCCKANVELTDVSWWDDVAPRGW